MVHESLAENVSKLHFYSESWNSLCLKCYFSYLLGIFYAGFKGYIFYNNNKIWKNVDVDVSKILIFWPLDISKFTSLTPILHSIFHNLCNI